MSITSSSSGPGLRRAASNDSMASNVAPPRRKPVRRPKLQTEQEAIDEFWGKFKSKTPGKATTVIPQNPWTKKIAHRNATIPTTSISLQTSYETAAAMCRAKVEKIVKECKRINKKYRDIHFDIETDLKLRRRDCLESLACTKDGIRPGSDFNPRSAKRVPDIFDDPEFYIDGPTANDVRQGRDGDCWLMAALCTLSNKQGLIERLCVAHDAKVGVYGFVFFRDGEWISEIVDDFLYLTKDDYDEGYLERVLLNELERGNPEEAYRRIYQTNSNALYFAQCAHPQETWLPLLEKAYAKAHGDFASIEGGFGGEGLEDLTGGVTSELYTTDILDTEYFWKEELLKVNQDFLFGCDTGVWGRGWGDRKGIIELHAYSVQRAVEIDGKRLLKLKNPWGKGEWKGAWSDGSKEWTPEWLEKLNHRFGDDGDFWIAYKDFLRKYQAFDRTRLFGPEWRLTQTWTTLDVPWTLEYHDTRFCVTLPKSGPVVIVLAQLDDRYYSGLQGQYHFVLAFRVHKAGHEDYLVRSERPYRMSRSVNVELDLEAGDYEVRVRLDTRRWENCLPVSEVLRRNVKTRREKMIRVGMNYDLAHSKGAIEETAEEKIAKEARDRKEKEKVRKETREKLLEDRERAHYLRTKAFNRQQKGLIREREKRKKHQAELKAARSRQKTDAEVTERTGEAHKRHEEAMRKHREAMRRHDEVMQRHEAASRAYHAKTPEIKIETPNDDAVDQVATSMQDLAVDAGPNESDGPGGPEMPRNPEATEATDAPEASKTTDASGVSEVSEVAEGSKTPETPETPEVSDCPETSGEAEKGNVSVASSVAGTKITRTQPPSICESDIELSDSDLETYGALSDASEREIDIQIDALLSRQANARVPPPQLPGPGFPEDEPDEFELNPWNAVAVIGLRIYSKYEEADNIPDVTLRVVRSNPYLDSGDEDSEELEKKVDGEKTGGLDVDDAVKDATLEGGEKERKKSIMGDGRRRPVQE